MSDPAVSASDVLPAPPRPLTPRIRRRAWSEPNVRFRWIFALIVLLGGIWFGISGLRTWLSDKSLLLIPTINATIKEAGSDTHPGRPVPVGVGVLVEWKKDGQPIQAWGSLSGYTSAVPPNIGEEVPIHVDPADPNHWTARNEPPSLMTNLFAAFACIVFALLACLAAWSRRRSVLRIWRDAPVAEADVMEWQHTPLAPRSRSAKCTLADDARIFHVIVPAAAAEKSKGTGVLQVLVPQQGQRMAVDWFA
jgi:hypothetical protein